MDASVFKFLAEIFKEAKIRYVLIGGYAVNSYKVTRHTTDIDFLITKEDFDRIRSKLLESGYSISLEHDIFVQLTNSQGLRDIDFMFSDPDTLEKIIGSANKTTIAGEDFLVPSLYNLIALKLHSIKYNPHRELNDLPDVVRLISANNLSINDHNLQQIFIKYGTEELYKKVNELSDK